MAMLKTRQEKATCTNTKQKKINNYSNKTTTTKKKLKKTCRVHTNAQNAVFHLNPDIAQRTSADVQNRFEHDAILKIIFEHFLIQHVKKNMQIVYSTQIPSGRACTRKI